MIRLANREDVPAMLAIYGLYIRTSAITFEYEIPDLASFEARFERIAGRYPWLVWEEKGRVLGFAYADAAFSRAAYAWDADLSIYLHMDERGRGIGGQLYNCLEDLLRECGYHNLYAIITGNNLPSVRFHERHGYERLGTLKQTGFKHGRWHDVHWYGKRLCPAEPPEQEPGAFICTDAIQRIIERYS